MPQKYSFLTKSDFAAAAQEIVTHLDSGGLIAYPTETVYGLGGAATVAGVENLIRLKGRSIDKNFLLLAGSQQMIDGLQLEWNDAARMLAGKHWPGPLTLVLRGGGKQLPLGVIGAGGTVAVRWTSHSAISQLLHAFGRPITSTSANVPGGKPATNVAGVINDYEAAINNGTLMLLDGGDLPPSLPSTVIDCTESIPRVIRSGAIHTSVLRETIPELIGTE